jgi:UDP-N-acetylglucosamine 1-carboxyvinyltransferase
MNFKITGGQKLAGTVTVNRSKNAAVALLCASLVNKGRTTLKNVPKIEEVYRVIEAIESIGVKVTWNGQNVEIVPPAKLAWQKLNQEAATRTRSVILLLGPLIHHFQSFKLPHPGGCKLGARTVRPHLYALEKLGVKVVSKTGFYEVNAPKLRPKEIILYETGDTVTENALVAATLISGKTTIKYASANYMVQDLSHYLELLGVRIDGIGTSTLTVHGVKEINQDVEFDLSEDPIEAMLFLSLAATTNSTITIKRCPIDFLELELLKLEKMGFKYKITDRYLGDNGFVNLVDIETRPSKLKALEEKIHPLPYPGINIDNLPFFVPIATQAKGTTLIHDWVYENRAIYYYEMVKLGANVLLADPHRVVIEGPTPLRATEVVCPPALRPAAIILIGMLAAKGESMLRNVYSINRGYENLVERLTKIGAKIEIIY